MLRRTTALTAISLSLTVTVLAAAQDYVTTTLDPAEALRFWTSEKFAEAVPPVWALAEVASSAPRPANEVGWGVPPSPASQAVAPKLDNRLFDPTEMTVHSFSHEKIVAPDVGQAKGYFSSSRLLPLEADLVYPYRTVGKLFSTTPTGVIECTASVIARRLILTAGHCVHSGTVSPGFYTNFIFVPSYRDGVAPYGSWPGAAVSVTSTWATGKAKGLPQNNCLSFVLPPRDE